MFYPAILRFEFTLNIVRTNVYFFHISLRGIFRNKVPEIKFCTQIVSLSTLRDSFLLKAHMKIVCEWNKKNIFDLIYSF